jgi:hypothetical protein
MERVVKIKNKLTRRCITIAQAQSREIKETNVGMNNSVQVMKLTALLINV